MDLNSSIDDDGTFSPIQFSFYHLAFGLELDMDLDRKVLEPDRIVHSVIDTDQRYWSRG